MKGECWRRNHREGIIGEESWMRPHGGGIMEEESWRWSCWGEINEETSGRHLGGIWEASTLGFPPLPETWTRKDMKAQVSWISEILDNLRHFFWHFMKLRNGSQQISRWFLNFMFFMFLAVFLFHELFRELRETRGINFHQVSSIYVWLVPSYDQTIEKVNEY